MPRKAAVSASENAQSSEASTFVSRVQRFDPFGGSAKGKAGDYRVIHGTVLVPRPESEWKYTSGAHAGERIPGAVTIEKAIEGDVLHLTDEDAHRMLESNVVEPVDAKPSRLGQIWQKPIPVRNPFVAYSAPAV